MEESSAHRLPPQSLEAEMSVLGGILLDEQALDKVLEILRPEDFYRDSHRKIFESLIALSEKNEPADLVTLAAQLQSRQALELVGGHAYLATLVDYVPTAANIVYYCRLVKERAIARNLISVATEIATSGYAGGNIEEILDQAEKSIFEIAENRNRPSYFAVRDILKDTFKNIEKLYERKELVTGVPSGYTDLDKMTAGLQPGDLVIIAGRPSMGKTAFCLNVAEYAAVKSERRTPSLIFSLEMGKEQLVQRLLCSVARVDASRMRTGHLGDSDWPKLTSAASELSDAKIFIDDTPAISALEVRSKARRLKAQEDIGLIIVDYLQLMRGNNPESRQQEISEISRSLKALAKELSVPVVALSQLNRSLENRTDKRPIMADLRESGAIEQDADVIMFVYRDEVYCPHCKKHEECNENHRGAAEIIIGKQRNGPIGTVNLAFRGEYTRFENLARREEGY
ncbi:replicative DNA helicase [Geoalkalibacter halelectricus]|uniref:Replicative DNA helicase n=1 Tax=Geoalkalibacter halelectricus TaxID=2847045 RepID=A0ABY5ZUD1_9BACT|nr:replicative DNA helicase [Geoalkalibacter halelectricus]MDO3377038.1 replicative DNA helicase [Geoalkalibacter halelectricus]UWZ81259.1 replicative DNA helicase [Geoalkalibacter halelectricus]